MSHTFKDSSSAMMSLRMLPVPFFIRLSKAGAIICYVVFFKGRISYMSSFRVRAASKADSTLFGRAL